jgi:uncharacterized protein (DUF983 family)
MSTMDTTSKLLSGMAASILEALNLQTFLHLRCPVCNKGKIFQGYLETPKRCPECGFYFMRETGYWLPHAPISYLFIVIAAVVVWFVERYILHIESDTVVLLSITVLPVLFAIWSNRYTKMIWMLLDLWLHPASQDDFEARGRE